MPYEAHRACEKFADLLGALEDATKRLQMCGCGFPRKPTRDDLAKRTEPLLHLAAKRERAKIQKEIDKIEVEWVKERATHELAECRAARCKDEIRAILRAAKDAMNHTNIQYMGADTQAAFLESKKRIAAFLRRSSFDGDDLQKLAVQLHRDLTLF